jgi:two-component system sensor kinase FixL
MKSRGAWRISCIYACFGEVWIILSSVLVWIQMREPPTLSSFLEVGKGTLFIAVTSVLLYAMLRRWEAEIHRRDTDLRQSEGRYRLLHESLRDGFVQVTMDGKFLDCNTVFCEMLGYSVPELLQRNYRDLTPPHRHSPENEIIANQVLVRGYSDVYETEYYHKTGTIIPAELRAILVRDDAGQPSSIYAIVRDTSERRAQEARAAAVKEQLIHAGRVQELGQVSAGIAHELNQPLAAMQNYASAAKRLIERGDGVGASQAVAKACEQATRAGDIIQRMRNFVEKRDTNKKRDDVNAIIKEAAALALIGAKAAGVEVHYDLAADLPPVIVDRVQIEQVLVNLLHNAMDAMAGLPQRGLSLSSRRDAEAVEIVVGDTGQGIPDEVLDTLFQPFVTTKQHGMGIGLSISKSIIEAHGGEIFAEPNPGGGTRFFVRLPPAPAKADAPLEI